MHPVDAPHNRVFYKKSTTAYAPGIMRCLNDFFPGMPVDFFKWTNGKPYSPGVFFSPDRKP